MRKFVALIVVCGMMAGNVFADFDDISFRMQGINPELAGIVVDEYTNWRANPADILMISGHRFYSIVSNLDGKGDSFGAVARNNNFQFGYVGNPIKNRLPSGQFGFLIHQGSSFGPGTGVGNQNAGGFAAANATTKVEDTDTTITDVDADGTLTSVGDTTLVTTRTGERYVESTDDVQTFNYGYKKGDNLNIAIGVERNVQVSEEPIKTTWNSVTTDVGDALGTNTENNVGNSKEEITNNDLLLLLGLRYTVNDRWNVGAVGAYMPHTWERERTSSVIYNRNITSQGNNPRTFTATGTDVPSIIAVTGALGAFADTDATTSLNDGGAGFAWDNATALGGLTYVPNDAVGKVEDKGNATQIVVDTYYNLTDDITLYGAISTMSLPYDRKLSASNDVTARWVDIAGANTLDVAQVTVTDTYTGSGDNTATAMAVTLGAEQNLPGNVKIGYGLIYRRMDADTNVTYTRSFRSYTTYDATGDGLDFGDAEPAGDLSTLVTFSDKWEEQGEAETITYDFPIGCELQPFKKTKLRLGATHTVRRMVLKTKVKILEDSAITTVVNDAGTPTATTTTYPGNQKITGDGANRITQESTTRMTTYYYGAGYQWSENLAFDILGFGSNAGAGLLGIESWNISATLMFGGGEEL